MNWDYIAGFFDGEGSVRFKAGPSRPNYIVVGLDFANTHRGVLEAMQAFMGCGRLQAGSLKGRYRRCDHLKIERVADILRVGRELLPRLVIKRDALAAMLAWAEKNRRPQSDAWGIVAAAGEAEVRRLYFDEGLTQEEVGRRLNVGRGSIATFMSRRGIKGRPPGPRPRAQVA